MARKTEQEVRRTLEFLNETDNIDFDPAFVDRVCNRMARMPVGGGMTYRGLLSSAVIVLFLLILNIMAGLALYEDRMPAEDSTESYASIMANEYLIDQDVEMTF